MKTFTQKITRSLALLSALLALTPKPVHAAAFTPGNIVVERVGDGSAVLSGTATNVFLDEYTVGGALVQSISLPTAAGSGTTPNQLTESGTASSDGMMTRSVDGKYLILPGFAANLGTASVASGAGIPRCVGVVKYDGTLDTTTAFTDGFVGNNFRSAASTDGSALWLAGNGGAANRGARYTVKGNTTSTNVDSTPNARCVEIYGGNLFYNSQTVIYKQTGTPIVATAATTITFSGTAPTSMYQFVFLTVPSGDVCYIADDGASGGILKYSVSGTTLTYQGKITAASVRGLTATLSGSTVTLFAATGGTTGSGGGTIWTVADTAANNAPPSTTNPTVVVTAATQTAFRGIALAPVSGATTYTVTYNGNGNTGGTAPTDASSPYASGSTVTVLGNTGNLTKTNYTFAVWNTAADGSGTAYAPTATFTIAANTTIFAQWTINTCTLTYTAGTHGTITGTSPQTVNYGANGTPVTAVPDSGYQFIGWSDASTSNPRTDNNVTANITVTANFAAAPTITTPTSAGITSTGATLGGNVTSDSGATITERGVVYSITSSNNNPSIGGAGVTKVVSAGTTGVFTVGVTGLNPGTGYSYKAYAINSAGTTYTTPTATFNTFVGVSFLGVAAGDVSSTDAVVWTRATDDTQPGAAINIMLQYSTDNTFVTGVSNLSVTTLSATVGDNIAKQIITNLTPATRYYYRFTGSGGELSNVGTFKTAPAANAAVPLHFAFSGDMDGLMRPYALASTVPAQALDFYLNGGDVIYENASAVAGNNGAAWLISPSVTLSGSPANLNGLPAATGAGTPTFAGWATQQLLFDDYNKKYREQFLPVNNGGQNSLKDFYAGQGNYTLNDNHELGNRQHINGGAPAGGSVGGLSGTNMPTGRGVDARNNGSGNVGNTNDANSSVSDFMNRSLGFQTLQQVYLNYQPIKENRATATVTGDDRTGTTKQLFFAQQWGKNALYVQTDTRSYRDIRLKTATGSADDAGPRADNTNRTYLGATQLAWLEQTLLAAETNGTSWKFVAVSDPIDQIGPISQTSGTAALSTLTGVNSDSGKSWIGGYRAERNTLLKFIADHGIKNVVFLATDDHQNRINEVLYATNGITGPGSPGAGTQAQIQAGYAKVPSCISVVCGPLGATGPDGILNHSFTNIQAIANDLAAKQAAAGIEPIGLMGYSGLHDVMRDTNGVLVAETAPQAVDFYSPDTFNYNILDVSADGRTLTVTSKGINSTAQNAAAEYGAGGNTVRTLFSFQLDAAVTIPVITAVQVSSGNVLIDFTAGAGDVIGNFSVVSTADLSTPLTPVAATITTSGPGLFRATIPVATPAAYYRIKR